jgi:hypothetical protein
MQPLRGCSYYAAVASGEGAMIGRALLMIAIVVGATVNLAAAQSDGTPGLPGGPPSGFADPPAQLPKCEALLATRGELQKHGAAIGAANRKKADVKVACELVRSYIATEAKMLRMLDEDGKSCGVPAHLNQQVRASHAGAQQIGEQVCDAAARQPFRYDAPPIESVGDGELGSFKLHPHRRPTPQPELRS